MTIGSIGSNNCYMGRMSGMDGRRSADGMPGRMPPPAGKAPPSPEEVFNKLDEDGSGGLDQTEFQTLADKIAETTDTDSEDLFTTYDADGNGILSQEETQTFMEANRPSGPPPGGMMGGQQGFSPGIGSYMKTAAMGMGPYQGTGLSQGFNGSNGMNAFESQVPFHIMA